MAETTGGRDARELRARFDAELRVGGLDVTGKDRERLYAMWEDHLPMRDAMRGAVLAPDEEATFIQKPARLPSLEGGASS